MSYVDLNSQINIWDDGKSLPYFENLFVEESHATPGPSTSKWSEYLKRSLLEDVNFYRGVNVNFAKNLYGLNLRYPLLFTSDEAKDCLLIKNNLPIVTHNTGPLPLHVGCEITLSPPLCKSKRLPKPGGTYPLQTYDATWFDVQINELLVYLKVLLDFKESLPDKTVLDSDAFWNQLSTTSHETMKRNYFWKMMSDAIMAELFVFEKNSTYPREVIKTICDVTEKYYAPYIVCADNPDLSSIILVEQTLITDNKTVNNCIDAIAKLSGTDNNLPSITDIKDADKTKVEGAKKAIENSIRDRQRKHATLSALMTYVKRFKSIKVAKVVSAKAEIIQPYDAMDIITRESDVKNPLMY